MAPRTPTRGRQCHYRRHLALRWSRTTAAVL